MNPPDSSSPQPHGELVIRPIAMPADANANGDILGGWLMSQMDFGGAILAYGTAHPDIQIARPPCHRRHLHVRRHR